jgi:hypothetical protein
MMSDCGIVTKWLNLRVPQKYHLDISGFDRYRK